MWRVFLALWIAVGVNIGRPVVLTAQDNTYDASALRIEGHLGDVRIVRGAEGTVLGRIGVFRGLDVAKLVSTSEKATVEAKKFSHDYGPGTWLAALGIATLGAAIGVSRIHDVNSSITAGLTLAGTGLIVSGGGKLQDAYNALSRSIWWYNRDLKR